MNVYTEGNVGGGEGVTEEAVGDGGAKLEGGLGVVGGGDGGGGGPTAHGGGNESQLRPCAP